MRNKAQAAITAVTSTLAVIFLGILTTMVDSFPMWLLTCLAVVLWMILVVLIIHDLRKPPTLYIYQEGQWVPIDPVTTGDIIKMQEEADESAEEYR